MAKQREAQPQIRKSFLIGGAAIVGVAVLAFVLSTFVLGGGSGGTSDTPAQVTENGAAAPSSSPGVATPSTDGTSGRGTSSLPVNNLKSGGKNPFAPKVSGATAAAAPAGGGDTSAASAGTKPGITTPTSADAVAHTWQLLDLKSGKATFLVDGKKLSGLGTTAEIVEGYTFNSVTGTCVTVKKGPSVFGLCPGAAPFSA